jgi:hypothetical protein
VLGTTEFQFDSSTARELIADKRARPFVRPSAGASELLRGKLAVDPDYLVDLSRCESEAEARTAGAAFDYVKKHVRPLVQKKADTATTAHYKTWLRTWWRPFWPRLDFLATIVPLQRIVVCSIHAARPVFAFLSPAFLPIHSLQLFGFDDDYSFGILQSTLHWRWALGKGSKLGESVRYTGDVWESFPWPQAPSAAHVLAVAKAARHLRKIRHDLMEESGWSLRDLYQAAEVEGPHPLKDAQAAIDAAVREAYGVPSDQDPLAFLLELNQLVAEDEDLGRKVSGPGLPDHLDPKDPRWKSADCIEPPRMG